MSEEEEEPERDILNGDRWRGEVWRAREQGTLWLESLVRGQRGCGTAGKHDNPSMAWGPEWLNHESANT